MALPQRIMSASTFRTTQCPAIQNYGDALAASAQAARSSAGAGTLNVECGPKMFSNEFSHMSNAVPGCFMLISNSISGANARPLRATDYDFNDEILIAAQAISQR